MSLLSKYFAQSPAVHSICLLIVNTLSFLPPSDHVHLRFVLNTAHIVMCVCVYMCRCQISKMFWSLLAAGYSSICLMLHASSCLLPHCRHSWRNVQIFLDWSLQITRKNSSIGIFMCQLVDQVRMRYHPMSDFLLLIILLVSVASVSNGFSHVEISFVSQLWLYVRWLFLVTTTASLT